VKSFTSVNLRAWVASAAPIALLMAAAHPAAAQQTAPAASGSPPVIQEVVVTAQRRSENVQKVPIAVTAFTAQALKEKSITDVSGLSRLTPNVNLDTASPFGGANEILSASIRGIGQDDFAINLDPGVGVYVDGVYYARTVGANVNMMDVDRVEILKGPQGTLFGRNTIGGAISVVTHTPGDVYKADTEVTFGSYNRRDFQGTVDLPISDTLLSSLTFSSVNRDGYMKRIPYTAQTGYVSDPIGTFPQAGSNTYSSEGGQGQDTLRGKLLWKAAPNFTVTATADWTHVAESSTPESLLLAPGTGLGGLYNGCVAGAIPGPACGPRGPGINAAGYTTANPGIGGTKRLFYGNQFLSPSIDETYSTGPDFNDMDVYGLSLVMDWSFAPNMDLKSITGVRRMNWDVALDPDGSPIDINQDSQKESQHQVSQEFQLNGDALDGHLKYTGGVYYFNEGGFEHDYVTLAGGELQINGTDDINTSSYAGYVHANYAVTDQFTVIVGARYSYDHKTIVVNQMDTNAFFYKIAGCYPVSAACATAIGFPVPSNPLLFVPNTLQSQNSSVFTPTLGVQYQFTPSIMGYATYSQGYKDGGWTTRLTAAVPALPSFGPERSKTYEAGVKSEWLDHSLQVNLAAFYTDYDGIQLNFQEGLSPTIQNAGNARIMGFEAEGRWLLGHGFSVQGAAGYMDAEYTSLEPGLNGTNTCSQPTSPCITLSSQLPKTPKWKVSISPQYLMEIDQSKIRFAVDYTYTTSMYNDSFNTSILERPATSMLDPSVTFIAPRDRYEVVVGGTNVTNQRYLVTGNEDASSGLLYGSYNAPAEWYVTVRTKF
jgi:iron complex outermembrane receptor protein